GGNGHDGRYARLHPLDAVPDDPDYGRVQALEDGALVGGVKRTEGQYGRPRLPHADFQIFALDPSHEQYRRPAIVRSCESLHDMELAIGYRIAVETGHDHGKILSDGS